MPSPGQAPSVEVFVAGLEREKGRKKEGTTVPNWGVGQAAKAVRSGRAFVRGLIDLSASTNQLDHFIHLNVDARLDIELWYQFVEAWNGVSMMATDNYLHPHVTVTPDVSGTSGCRALVEKSWFQLKLVDANKDCHITIKELTPVIVAVAIWGKEWQWKTVWFQCNNTAVVAILNQGSTRDKEAMQLIRCLALFIR